MANQNNKEKHLICNFCGKSQDEVERMFIGPGVNICSECIEPVSYTHLDVYKRQVPHSAFESIGEDSMSNDLVNQRQIQWFPGHMAKTLRVMESSLKQVDVILQILDARIPYSSLNPEIARITRGKPHLYVLNKADLADPNVTARWV